MLPQNKALNVKEQRTESNGRIKASNGEDGDFKQRQESQQVKILKSDLPNISSLILVLIDH